MTVDGAEFAGATRREFLTLAAAGAAVLGLPKPAAARGPVRGRRQTVAVFGGGVAGLTAAHELVERGFDVTVYERRQWGGKARSVDVADSARGGRLPLPGEHGFRIFFGYYQNNPDTFRRIPDGANPNGVFDNLVGVPQFSFSREAKRDLVLPVNPRDPRAFTPALVQQTLLGAVLQLGIPPDAAGYFADRMAVYLSSCDDRRLGEWDSTPWTTFIRTDRWPGDYAEVLGATLTHFLQASRAEGTSAAFVGNTLELIVYSLLGLGANGPPDRVLNAPTNQALIYPWLRHLRRLGARLRLGYALANIDMEAGRIAGVGVQGPAGPERVTADWYICALPVERARALWTPAVLTAAPQLTGMFALRTAWMNGVQLYLRRPAPLIRGHLAFMKSPWKVSGIGQGQFWPGTFSHTYGDGQAADCFSAVVSDWETAGVVFGKPARDCTPEQIAREVWEQMKRHLNDSNEAPLTDDLLLSWSVDPGLVRHPDGLRSQDPLVLPSVGAWRHRPDVGTQIPNLLLAGDYPRGGWDVANMEAANASGRAAANVVLDRAGSREQPVTVIAKYRPPEWEAFKTADARRYKAGQPNIFDTDKLPGGKQRAARNPLAAPSR